MKDNELEILGQYNIDVKNTRKVRDAFLCETSEGLILVKELRFSEKRLSVLEYLGNHLQEQGLKNIDWILKNKENQLFSISEEGTKYFLKKWFAGKECDIHKEKDVLDAVVNLTKIHMAMKQVELKEEEEDLHIASGEDVRQEFFRHNREMKKVRSFMRGRVGKGDFELAFLKHFDSMYEQADAALCQLNQSKYEFLLAKCKEKHTWIHGDYNYHNILMTYSGVATTNFEHVKEDIQVTDFYYFLRKVMEKNHWDTKLGDKMLRAYQRYIPISDDEMNYIAICLAYPEKFWKAANSYYRSRKVWLPAKNLEKLELFIKQSEEKKTFLETIFSFHL